jgi:hypothetical protein
MLEKHMKRKVFAMVLSSIALLCACEGNTSSEADKSSSSDISETTSSSGFDSASSEEINEEKADYSSLPYLDKVSDYKKTDWHGKWVWANTNPKDSYFAFRKSFTLDSKPSKGLISISADSKFTLYVNGTMVVVDGNTKRGESVYDSYYQVYDISEYLLKGTNLLAFEVNYFGRNGNSSIDSGHGGLLFDLDVDGKIISSDSSVKWKRLSAYKNETNLKGDYPGYPQSSFLAEHDIYFDAREAEDGFMNKDYDDSSWKNCAIVATPGYLPFGEVYLNEVPSFSFDQDVTLMDGNESLLGSPLSQDVTLTFSLDSNRQFLPYFKLSANGGERITFYTNSYLSPSIASFKDDYICKEGTQSYNQLYWRSGYKFIMEVPKGVTILEVGYRKTGYNAKRTGSFVSSDSSLNTLWGKAANTLDICMRDNYMDCPERERSPYTGDSANQMAETFYALDEDGWKLVKKTLLTLPGWVGTDNIIPSRSPSATTNEIPMQNLSFIVTACDYYLYSGDSDTMKRVYDILLNYLKVWDLNEDGSVKYRNGTFPWVDWGTGYDSEVMENCWYYYAMKKVHTLGSELSLLSGDDEAYLTGRESSIKTAFSKFKTSNGYTSGSTLDDRANALAVLSGLADEDVYPAIKTVLTTVLKASPYMEKYVLEALCVMGEEDASKSRMLTRYQDMIDYETTTLWEEWTVNDGSVNHGWTGGCLVIMSKYYAGIKPLSAGYQSYEIKPCSSFSSLSSSATTPDGLLSYSLSKNGGVTTIDVVSPNDGGRLVLDPSYGTSLKVNGTSQSLNKDDDGNIVVSLSKGSSSISIA